MNQLNYVENACKPKTYGYQHRRRSRGEGGGGIEIDPSLVNLGGNPHFRTELRA